MCYFVQENIYHFFTLPSLFRAVVIGGLEGFQKEVRKRERDSALVQLVNIFKGCYRSHDLL